MDNVIFVISRVIGTLLKVESVLVLMLVITTILAFAGRRRASAALALASTVLLLLIGTLPIGDLLMRPLESRYPADPPLTRLDGIVVLGGGEALTASRFWDQPLLGEGGERYVGAVSLARRFPDARLVFSGGSNRLRDLGGAELTEGGIARRLFADLGIAPERLAVDETARNTTENARASLTLAAPAEGEVWALVTTAYHMPRAMRSFEAAGWRGLIAYPVDFRSAGFVDGIDWRLAGNLDMLNIAMREWIGQLAYAVTGR